VAAHEETSAQRRPAAYSCFAAAMQQSCGGIFEGHSSRQSVDLLDSDVQGHTHAADRRSTRYVIDHGHGFEPNLWLAHQHDLGWSKLIPYVVYYYIHD
jgi:hypothetical protein